MSDALGAPSPTTHTHKMHRMLVVEVQDLELDACVRGMQVDLERVRACRAVEGPDAAERSVGLQKAHTKAAL